MSTHCSRCAPRTTRWSSACRRSLASDRRFRNARLLAAYAGLVPSVRQSGDSNQLGRITKEGSKPLRTTLVQCAHVVARTSGDDAAPLRAHFDRIRGTRGRRKIALVALARHLLRVAFHVWKDGTDYDAGRLTTD